MAQTTARILGAIVRCSLRSASMPVSVGITPPSMLFTADLATRRDIMTSIADAGLDGVLYADHVSFRGGHGTEALVLLAALSQLHPTLGLHTLYLLPLRHPVTVARSVATLAEWAPGRLELGVGIGGEDRHEIEVCGVDPATRGRRCNESLEVLRPLLAGEEVTFRGEFFDIEACSIRPVPDPPVPVLVGGRSDAAIRRAGRYGDGWLGAWCSPKRFSEAIRECAAEAERFGRSNVAWRHKYQVWVGIGRDQDSARNAVKAAMEGFYRIPFEPFERYTPVGTPEEVADRLRAFVDVGVHHFDLMPCVPDGEDAIALAGEVKRLLVER